MSASKIPDGDWNVIKKYSIRDIQKQFLSEESVSKPNKDYFSKSLILINISLIIIVYLFNDAKYYNIFILLFPLFITAAHAILGHYYGKEKQFQAFALFLNLSLFLLAELAIIYYNFKNLNSAYFIFYSFYGISIGIIFGFSLKEIIYKNVIIYNFDQFNIEVLSHTEKLGSYENILKNIIDNVIDLKELPAYDGETGKIYPKVGFTNIYLLYVIVENNFAFSVFIKNGRYIFQDEKSMDIQKEISFLLKNALDFKSADEEQTKNNAIDSCLILLKQYTEPNTIRILIEKHKIPTFFIISVGILVFSYKLYSQYMDEILGYVSDSIIPVVISATVVVIIDYYLRRNK